MPRLKQNKRPWEIGLQAAVSKNSKRKGWSVSDTTAEPGCASNSRRLVIGLPAHKQYFAFPGTLNRLMRSFC